jgi:hypothetical protein
MDVSSIRGNPKDVVERLAKPFFDEGAKGVFIAACCGRLFAGVDKPKKCRVCGREPISSFFTALADIDLEKVKDHPPPLRPLPR